ncbi:Zn-dependent oxidoreductase, NADPH:quinone reductase [Frankia canadensis]|uniref:Zn-dependent oxidoreductase, NADPH:quinone reductase n=1 Tax=Frankia canadensis TaxID=1836972 RepID=A0A2I2L089_9ACTN|nr:NADP-dependent oxidoreductase [Frankia canadensis]SNQ51343.1 Zn-dependent oxidoreductase, NADPH:quinone reductase [Frankia canadensis]SOU58633.1 Zn-dependent oxidoreductase, NADPH:quinone reductase [Frankia canadensis]
MRIMKTTMRAVIADDYGPPERLTVGELPIPRPDRGQIQVRVRATALNPGELRLLGGELREMAPLSFPHVIGGDFAGTVTEVGAGVTRFRVGDEVFGLGLPRHLRGLAAQVASPPSLTTGTLAEYAVFEADTPGLTIRPPGLSVEHAAALPTVGLTALPLIRALEHRRGDVVLVIGATGGVGGVLVPMLAAAGVHVIATASAGDGEYVRGLGARETVDHRAGDTADDVARRYPKGVDAVVNLALPGDDLADLARLIRPAGRLLNIVFPVHDPLSFTGSDLIVETLFTAAVPGDLDVLAEQALDGMLPNPIGRRYLLAEGARACVDLLRQHTRGKLVVVCDDEA